LPSQPSPSSGSGSRPIRAFSFGQITWSISLAKPCALTLSSGSLPRYQTFTLPFVVATNSQSKLSGQSVQGWVMLKL
jgi:hypothetical protein